MEVKIETKYFYKDKGIVETDTAPYKLRSITKGATPDQDVLHLEPEWGRKPGKEKNYGIEKTRKAFLEEFTNVSVQAQREAALASAKPAVATKPEKEVKVSDKDAKAE